MRSLFTLLALLFLSVPAPSQAAAADEQASPWTKLPPLPGDNPNISGIGVDPAGTLWVMLEDRSSGRHSYWLDSDQWRKVNLPDATVEQPAINEEDGDDENADDDDQLDETEATGKSGQTEAAFLRGLHGGNGAGLYAVAAQGRRGMLYELNAGSLKQVATFTFPSNPEDDTRRRRYYRRRPTLFVSRAGRPFCCGASSVSMFVDGQWRQVAHLRPTTGVAFLDAGEQAYIFHDAMLSTVPPDGEVTTQSFDGLNVRPDNVLDPYLWGDGRLLVVENRLGHHSSVLYAYDLETGKRLDISEIRDAMKTQYVFDAFSGPDGTVWLYTSDPAQVPTVYSFRFLTPDGDLFEIEETKQLDWSFDRSRFFPQSVLVASDGTVWLAQRTNGVVSYRNGVFTRYGADAGFAFGFRFLAEAPDGTIYAASSNEVYTLPRKGHAQ